MNHNVRELQIILLGMLRDIDAVCKKGDISYQLFAGSALGAVRENGFIPWDDDLDIAMSREDYEKFLVLAEELLNKEKYYLQKEYSEHFYMFNSKLRLNGTTYMERYIPRDKQMHQGIFVDVFPIDNLSDNGFTAKLQFYASKVVIAKCLKKRGYASDSAKKKLFMIFCSVLPFKPFRSFVMRKKDKGSKKVHSFFGGSSKYERSVYPRAFLKTVDMRFEDGEYPVSAQYDTVLSIMYGDYMTPTKDGEKDIKRHYLKVDTNNSYEKYIEWQRRQKITSYTKSIR